MDGFKGYKVISNELSLNEKRVNLYTGDSTAVVVAIIVVFAATAATYMY